jgi:hypothetical protein
MSVFTYIGRIAQKTVYTYQVGIYKEKENMQNKINDLKNSGYEGYCYQKDNQYYVLSMISENYEEVKKHSQKVKGIIKSYVVDESTTVQSLLKLLEKGECS